MIAYVQSPIQPLHGPESLMPEVEEKRGRETPGGIRCPLRLAKVGELYPERLEARLHEPAMQVQVVLLHLLHRRDPQLRHHLPLRHHARRHVQRVNQFHLPIVVYHLGRLVEHVPQKRAAHAPLRRLGVAETLLAHEFLQPHRRALLAPRFRELRQDLVRRNVRAELVEQIVVGGAHRRRRVVQLQQAVLVHGFRVRRVLHHGEMVPPHLRILLGDQIEVLNPLARQVLAPVQQCQRDVTRLNVLLVRVVLVLQVGVVRRASSVQLLFPLNGNVCLHLQLCEVIPPRHLQSTITMDRA
mmetsp:Transcript_13687/g.26983  ORF Transcript_13687/g.26983 Transcript_13687/m.26983 type:complete len:298 (-) Transcript_13687:439-1332(-)